jgi:lipopolysaccharide/colanic/teichoic acid biosynthesis glycosyltransferase
MTVFADPSLGRSATLSVGAEARTAGSLGDHRPRLAERELRLATTPAADLPYSDHGSPRPRSELLCRAVNVTIAALAILVLAPALVIVALAIRLSSEGPILYRQTRVGLDRRRRAWSADEMPYDRRIRDVGGRPFTIYKFRTMRLNAERAGAVWATKKDPRITTLGLVLRKTRIDEIPQLINVLLGDMNIVGPRPERPILVSQLREQISDYPLRHRAKPGITGWAQINQSYDACLDDVRAKVRFDLEYLQRQSVAEDLLIMARTIPVMLLRRGAN